MKEIVEKPKNQNIGLSLRVASMPWAFTQRHFLDTSEFIREAKRRGVSLDLSILRELYRHRLLIPFAVIRQRRVETPITPVEAERFYYNAQRRELRDACNSGRVQDLSTLPFLSRLQFDKEDQAPYGWWNGLIYSWHQLLALSELLPIINKRRSRLLGGKRVTRLPMSELHFVDDMARFRKIAIVATALEARYLPTLDPEWVHLNSANPEEWKHYRNTFDAYAMSRTLDYGAKEALRDAEYILFLAHRIDPVGAKWSRLMRRAPRDSWKDLKDAALSAMDLRETAEILLCYYQDLASLGQTEPLPKVDLRGGWHPLQERLSDRQDTLDQNLMDLGISPHPRVVLAVEGDSEAVHAPKVWKALEYPDAPELIRILNLGGTDRDTQKVAALAAAPLVGLKEEGRQEFWWLIKPPTRFMVAADPEGNFALSNVDRTRALIIEEIKSVLKAQGVTAKDDEINELVEIRTWSQSCFEFAHFSDEELADGIARVHITCNDWSRDELIGALSYWRNKRKDIKRVWESGKWDERLNRPDGKWQYEVSKRELAEALWPALEQKIQQARLDEGAPIPEIADVLQRAYLTAQQWRYQSFVLTAID